MSVGFSVHSVQCQSAERRLSSIAFNASSVQHQFSFLSSLQGRVCSIHSQWCSVLPGLHSTAFMVCLLLFSVGSVQFSIQLSVGFRVYIVFSVSSVSVAFSECTVQWAIPRLYSSVSAVFRALAVHQESVMFKVHTLKVLCPCAVLEC